MKRTNKRFVVDLTLDDDDHSNEIDIKAQFKSKTQRKIQNQRKRSKKENSEKFIDLSRNFQFEKFENTSNSQFQNMAAAANAAIAQGFHNNFFADKVAEINALHQAIDVDHSHIFVGDPTVWNNLPHAYKVQIIARKFDCSFLFFFFLILIPILAVVRRVNANVSEMVVQTIHSSYVLGRNITLPYLTGAGLIAPIPNVRLSFDFTLSFLYLIHSVEPNASGYCNPSSRCCDNSSRCCNPSSRCCDNSSRCCRNPSSLWNLKSCLNEMKLKCSRFQN